MKNILSCGVIQRGNFLTANNISLLHVRKLPLWMTPQLKIFFTRFTTFNGTLILVIEVCSKSQIEIGLYLLSLRWRFFQSSCGFTSGRSRSCGRSAASRRTAAADRTTVFPQINMFHFAITIYTGARITGQNIKFKSPNAPAGAS